MINKAVIQYYNMMTSNVVPTIAFTLPISCQICLGKVKQPVVCCNRHAFCSSCMDLWLERNAHCPACRVPVTADNPCRPVLGGLSLDPSTGDMRGDAATSRELRRARIDLLFKDYEKLIESLQSEVETLRSENISLRDVVECHTATANVSSTGCNNSPSKGCSHDSQLIQMLKSKLRETALERDKAKRELDDVAKETTMLRDANVHLERENQRLRVDLTNRSPRRFGRCTVVALESRLESSEKEIQQLHRALEKSDEHIGTLEKELTSYRAGKNVAGQAVGSRENNDNREDEHMDSGHVKRSNSEGLTSSVRSLSQGGLYLIQRDSENKSKYHIVKQLPVPSSSNINKVISDQHIDSHIVNSPAVQVHDSIKVDIAHPAHSSIAVDDDELTMSPSCKKRLKFNKDANHSAAASSVAVSGAAAAGSVSCSIATTSQYTTVQSFHPHCVQSGLPVTTTEAGGLSRSDAVPTTGCCTSFKQY